MAALRLELRTDNAGHSCWQVVTARQPWSCRSTGLLLCDVWDRHWCRGANERLAGLLGRMNQVVFAARSRGLKIIHAPSDTVDFYAGTQARECVLAAPAVSPPPDRELPDPPLPVDASDEGADTGETQPFRAWTRQHPAIDIDYSRDAISDDGVEVYRFMRCRGLDRLLIMGVHTNMCVLHRSFGIKQMVRWGVPVALIRDLTDAMYNPARPPYVDHAEGTRLVVEFIEKFWCPTVTSRQILTD